MGVVSSDKICFVSVLRAEGSSGLPIEFRVG
jgi:hypothetical protein